MMAQINTDINAQTYGDAAAMSAEAGVRAIKHRMLAGGIWGVLGITGGG